MKTLICSLALSLVAASGAQAQIAKGTTLLTGNIGYISVTNKSGNYDSKVSRFEGNLGAGHFLADNLMLGLNLGYVDGNEDYPIYNAIDPFDPYVAYGNYNTKEFSLGPVLRYYKFVGGDQAAFFGQVGGGYRSARQLTEPGLGSPSFQHDRKGFYGQLAPGFVFFPTPKFGLELSLRGLSYEHMKEEASAFASEMKTSSLDFGFGLNDLRFGASFYLGRN